MPSSQTRIRAGSCDVVVINHHIASWLFHVVRIYTSFLRNGWTWWGNHHLLWSFIHFQNNIRKATTFISIEIVYLKSSYILISLIGIFLGFSILQVLQNFIASLSTAKNWITKQNNVATSLKEDTEEQEGRFRKPFVART